MAFDVAGFRPSEGCDRGVLQAGCEFGFGPMGISGVVCGSGVEDDMWLDKAYLRQLLGKAARPTSIAAIASFCASTTARHRWMDSVRHVAFDKAFGGTSSGHQ